MILCAPRIGPVAVSCSLVFLSSHGVLIDAAPRKGNSPGGRSSMVTHTAKPFSRCRHVPWRAAARAGRQRLEQFTFS